MGFASCKAFGRSISASLPKPQTPFPGERLDVYKRQENYAEKEGFTVKTICDISEDTQHVVRECLILHPDIISRIKEKKR